MEINAAMRNAPPNPVAEGFYMSSKELVVNAPRSGSARLMHVVMSLHLLPEFNVKGDQQMGDFSQNNSTRTAYGEIYVNCALTGKNGKRSPNAKLLWRTLFQIMRKSLVKRKL